MSTSVEKINDLRRRGSGAPSPDADPTELVLRSLARMGGPVLDTILPEDPGALDELIEQTCRFLASLRSDGAPEIVIYESGTAELEAP